MTNKEFSNKKIAYCFLVSNEARDFYLLIPYIYYLEKFQNYNVSIEFIWNAYKIRAKRPDLVILPNVRGNHFYYELAKYCKENEILVFHHDSEGNFSTQNKDYDYWGYNRSKELFCPIQFTWNKVVKSYLEENFPIFKDNIQVSGAPGFDKYAYSLKPDRYTLLKKYGKEKFDKVIGYAGWAFGKIYNKELVDVLTILQMEEENGVRWLEDNRDFVEDVLKSAIENHPDVLFILKKHPRENFESDYRDSRNEMNRLTSFPNVLYLKDQEEIQDLIAISDLWMAFESTSTMEAWILDVPTVIINKETEFNRSIIYQGSLIVHSKEECETAINNLYNHSVEYLFQPDFISKRNMILQNSIGFSDGYNHLRTAYYFQPFLDNQKIVMKKPAFNWEFFKQRCYLVLGRLIYSKRFFNMFNKLRKNIWVMENYRLDKLKDERKRVYVALDNFYEKHQIDDAIREGDFWKQLKF